MPITTVILAGGKGTRIGGNKGLQLLHGRALIDWVDRGRIKLCTRYSKSASSRSATTPLAVFIGTPACPRCMIRC